MELIDDVVSVAISAVVTITVVAVEAIVLSVVRLITGRQRASAITVHVSIVGRRGISRGGWRRVFAAVCTTATAGLMAVVAHFPEAGFGFYYGW